MKTSKLYPPLRFLNDCFGGADFNKSYDAFYTDFISSFTDTPKNELPSENEFIRVVLDRGFMKTEKTDYSDKAWYKTFCKNTTRLIPDILKTLGYTDADILNLYYNKPSNIKDLYCELRDVFVEGLIINKWVRNKQVLKPDMTFAKHLLTTDKLDANLSIFEHLPFDTFYIDIDDLNADNYFGDIHGIFVNVTKTNSHTIAVTLYCLSRSMMLFSNYISLDTDMQNVIETSDLKDVKDFYKVPNLGSEFPNKTTINMKEIVILVMQLICYMNVKEPDIEVSDDTKQYYRPSKSKTVKNKYSEIYKQDIGIRIGKKITQNYNNMKTAQEKQTRKAQETGRKPPIPHFRSAHWHKYHTGKNRVNQELRWIEPVFVCGEYSSNNTDVIMHKVE